METKEQPIVLVLTREQAQTLIDLTANVAGDTATTYRRHTESIQNQLNELGFEWRNDTFKSDSSLWANEMQEKR